MKKIVFLTGTRADFGKMKPLMNICERLEEFELYVYVSGMHLLPQYGSTYREVANENYKNTTMQPHHEFSDCMDINLSRLIADFSEYVKTVRPDMIVVHGDRIDALGGAIVAMLNGILLGHIEGGEVTGTVDESIRHAISKMANLHFVSNEESAIRLRQLGEEENCIFVIGSPDIDIMLSGGLPALDFVLEKQGIPFRQYAILIYHPVVSEVDRLAQDMDEVVRAVCTTNKNYIVIYPNNDTGSQIILQKYQTLSDDPHFCLYPSIPFEDFLVLLKNAEFILGNSSCGVREACVYGVPAIDVGTRQKNRYSLELLANIQHVEPERKAILDAVSHVNEYRIASSYFGTGKSAEKFAAIIRNEATWNVNVQKRFLDTADTRREIQIYHNEVCF